MGRVANQLASATSPYLLQHADNPVDWWQWSPEAFAEARRRDVPVLISIGYAACHWCHVMAHESFENPEIAATMNADFVCVKVDREERPDVDAVYMEATQAMTGQGGWPMTVFATPTGDPFYCGTYFPARSGHGLPSFPELLAAVASAWRERRDEVVDTGAQVAAQLSGPRSLGPAGPLTGAVLDAAVDTLRSTFDVPNGGFGGAPKFPPSTVLEFLLRHRARTGSDDALWMVEYTAERMARGGMYDQLAGGFARYAVDERWVVPHFEKMLYDNALLLRVYTGLWRETGSALARRIAVETAGFLIADLRTPEGGFASALDADTDGVEGATYVWTPDQLVEVLGPDDGAWAARVLAVDEAGTFEHGTSVAQLPSDPADPARWAAVRSRLLQARRERPQPARDDKVVASWNGLAIAALADAGLTFTEPSLVEAAVTAGRLLRDLHLVDGRLRRVSRSGVVGDPAGVLEDYANVASGWLALHQATGSGEWLTAARALLDVAVRRFADPSEPGAFFDAADDAERLFRRPADPADGPTPAGVAALCDALVTATALTGDPSYRETAEPALARLVNLVERAPRAAGWAAAVGEALLAGPVEVAVAGPPGPVRDNLAAVVRAATVPGRVVVVGEPDAPGVPLLADRRTPSAPTAAYVCRGFVCDAPTTDAEALAARVRALR